MIAMKYSHLFLAILLAAFTLTGFSDAHANACGSAARAMVSGKPGATLLSVSSKKNANGATVCVARIKLAAKNGKPPRVVVQQFRP